MGSLAGLLVRAGHRVTGSDTAFYPPMGEALERWGIEKRLGYDPAHLEPRPDLVVVGNVCRRDNPEARAAIDGGMRYLSLPAALGELFLEGRRSFVVAGTHGKTTTTALLAFLLDRTGQAPGFLIGGLPGDFAESFRSAAPGAPFVVEGDEYDSAFFEKSPKFWQYRPEVACINALEHDHIDIYPDLDSYRAAFERFAELLPVSGLLVAHAGDPEVRAAAQRARCRVRWFALEGAETGGVKPDWLGRLVPREGGGLELRVSVDGGAEVRAELPLSGEHNALNAMAALVMAREGAGVALPALLDVLPRFTGIRRRQELRGTAGGVRVYDDFAHHPTAVRVTLDGLRQRHPEGRLFALFEPRSATASRKIHQEAYVHAFGAASVVLLAQVGRPEVADAERLDVAELAAALRAAGGDARGPLSVEQLVATVAAEARAGDTVVVMSNGAFGGIHDKLLAALG
jgi:UDP-N-acetylmuramate: L-alanyl-gamma-D-glutamyl-meso-diaminopimelate ligase